MSLESNDVIVCPVCKIRKINGVFTYSHQNTTTVPNQVYTKICRFIQKRENANQCINKKGEYREAYDFETDKDYLDTQIKRVLE